jgi:hypothetical protein
VNLRFTVVADDLEVIQGVGEVVRVSGRPKGMGVVFVELTEHSADLVNKLMVRRMTSGQMAEDEELAATTIRMNPLEVERAIGAPPRRRQQTLPPPPPKPKARR